MGKHTYVAIKKDELEKILGGTAARELGQLFRNSRMVNNVLALDYSDREEIWKLFNGAQFNFIDAKGREVDPNSKMLKAAKINGTEIVDECCLSFVRRFFPEIKHRNEIEVGAA